MVTAQDGTRRTYTVNVVRRGKGIVFDADDSFSGTQEPEEAQAPEPAENSASDPGKSADLSAGSEDIAYPKKGTKEWYLEKASLTFDSMASQPVPYYIYGAGAAVLCLLILVIALPAKKR